MSILIKGMEMPRSCAECPVNMNICKRGYKYLLAHMELYDQRADDCPITTVPPHYDLIDHNALKIAVMDCDAETRIDFLKHAMDCINKAPVVIPSDMPTYEAEEG